MADKFERMTRALPSFYKAELNTMIRGLLQAWAISDEEVQVQIQNTKEQIFVETAASTNLDRLGSNVGVSRASELGLDDSDFRELIPVMSFFPKQVRKTIISLLDVFWGAGFTRPNVNAGNNGPYTFGPTTLAGGTANFLNGNKTVRGTGTQFTLDLQPGDYIKPVGADGTTYSKVSEIIDDTTLELSVPWEHDVSINAGIDIGVIRELEYNVDGRKTSIIRFKPNAFSDITNITITELVNFINNNPEHNGNLTASEFLDPVAGSKLNLRTNTPGLQGSIQILGGDANAPTRLNFSTAVQTETRAKVIEINPNEIIVQIPSSVPVLRRTLKGSAHPRQTKTQIFSNDEVFNFSTLGASSTLELTVDSTPYVVNFNHALDFADAARVTSEEVARAINAQLTFLNAFDHSAVSVKAVGLQTTEGSSEYQITGGTANAVLGFDTSLQQDPDLIETDFPSSYVFDPVGQLFTVTGTKSELSTAVSAGTVSSTMNLVNASSFPNRPGKFLMDFGRANQEGPIDYTSRPNNATLLIDASHIFESDHAAGRTVNLISDTPTIPRLTGDDYPVYVVGTEEARTAAQDLIRKLLASGVVIRFLVDFPEFLFECVCRGCGAPEDADYKGALTASPPLVF